MPPGKHSVTRRVLPVANSCPMGHVKLTSVPKAVSRLEAKAPMPGCSSGQSAEKVADQLRKKFSLEWIKEVFSRMLTYPAALCSASEVNLINISPEEAVKVSLGAAVPVKPLPECRRNPEVEEPSNT